MQGPIYQEALSLLQTAHDACYQHKDRDLLGMSYGPFSGVNQVLGIVSVLEKENEDLRKQIIKLREKEAKE